ncbi:uncharacterized protein ANIA_10768 [Aspergillus nidulans FGSC A4]|uniref:FAD dependent oxidoreductase domain-containing protein n=1 Tax=Emericella nidulans (strain FGSC A4 / ATCC 38163 / CBS 112.46 / NRRL 194 / M139) TaxID=227321 RepID=C8V324_EMENI|nr:hypothetical protein [Aspergillus nidulans FGSC A4]CBF70344.1 TPA: conserved hypothetical protein [Aspergillus nidulans FGSC A4]
MAPFSKSIPIAIIGDGAFGLSTALHLVQNGYTDITVLEQDEKIPPPYSAANYLNKIVREEYEDPFYTNLTVLCPMGSGYINTDKATGVSHSPFPVNQEASSGFLPAEDETRIRKLLQQTLPALANRPLVLKSLCWFADTKDSDFIIDFVPGSKGSVVIESADSGHGFKMFPIVGSWTSLLSKRHTPNSIHSGKPNRRYRPSASAPISGSPINTSLCSIVSINTGMLLCCYDPINPNLDSYPFHHQFSNIATLPRP